MTIDPAEREQLIRAEWKRQGIPTDVMDGGHRTATAWILAAFDAGYAAALQQKPMLGRLVLPKRPK